LLDEAATRQTNRAHPTFGKGAHFYPSPWMNVEVKWAWGRKETVVVSPQSAGLGVSSCISCDVVVVFVYWVLPMHLAFFSWGFVFMSQFFSKNMQKYLQGPSLRCSHFSCNILKYWAKSYLRTAISMPLF